MLKKTIKNLLHFSTSSEILLLLATISALVVANSQFYNIYNIFFNEQIVEKISLKFFIDDFLMAIFFLLIGLELKREVLIGELSSRSKIIFPAIAACGGVIIPSLIFIYFNANISENMRGFAIPTATDIAFAYAIVKAFGNKISNATKVFIITLAVIDDLIAIFIIAFFYTKQLHIFYLLLSLPILLSLLWLSVRKSQNLFHYLTLGCVLWFLILKSGIHPSVVGVVLAMFIPFKGAKSDFFENFSRKLAPFVNFLILPVFAFANAGVRIEGFSLEKLRDPLIIGVACGLFFGKQIGVSLFSFIAIKLKICLLPKGANWLEFYGVAILAGIGFTMSLFIGNLAFESNEVIDKIKIAVFLGSILSFVFGALILSWVRKK